MTDRMSAGRPDRLKVLVAKMGLDGHDRGAKIVARTLRDCGHEVVYLGRRQSTATIVTTAIQEDVDVIGLSVLSGTHVALVTELARACAEADLSVPIVVGGTVLRRDVPVLTELGVRAVFPVGSPLEDIRICFDELAHEAYRPRAAAE